MKTLEEFNSERWRELGGLPDVREPHPNGISCPECGKELWDSCPMITITSNPPQKDIHCSDPECGYRGYRLA